MANRGGEEARRHLLRLCYQGLDAWRLRTEALPHLRAIVPFDCAWWATADPSTLLFTGALSDEIPAKATPLFLANELFEDDLNKFCGLAGEALPVKSLNAATEGDLHRSHRFREILRPFRMGDELRMALLDGGLCWGFICLHRALGASAFSPQETAALNELRPHLASALRNALLLANDCASGSEPLGVVTLSDDLLCSIRRRTPRRCSMNSPTGPLAQLPRRRSLASPPG